jgi:hypothetical protein
VYFILIPETFSDIIKPEELQELYLQLCFRYLDGDCSEDEPQGPVDSGQLNYRAHPDILREIFRGTDSIIRKLSSLAEMQFRFSDEVDDFICGIKRFQDAFFLDPSFEEIDLTNLALVCDLTYDKENPVNTLNDIT